MAQTSKTLLAWTTPEYLQKERSQRWYFIVAGVVLALAVVGVFTNNVLFSIMVILVGFMVFVFALRKPHNLEVRVNPEGVSVNDRLYSYKTIDSFWIREYAGGVPILMLNTTRVVFPMVIIMIPRDIDPERVMNLLAEFIPMQEHEEPIAHRIGERFGL